jgi:hypothetical protein
MPLLLGLAIQDSSCFQGYLASMATILVLAKTKENGVALSHQGRAIKFLISGCQDTSPAATDINIMTASFLASNDLCFGNLDAAEQNLVGISSLVRMRGGLHNLGMGGALACMVSGVDQYVAIFRNRMPTYNMSLPAITLDLPSYKPNLGRAFRDLLSTPNSLFDPQLMQAAVNFSQLMDIYERGANKLASAAELTYFEYLQVAVEHQLTQVNSRLHDTNTANECVCVALLLCNLNVCRNYGSVFPFHRILASRLWRLLLMRHVQSYTLLRQASAKLVIWLLFISLSTALVGECPHAVEAVCLLSAIRRTISLGGWKDLKQTVLDIFVWSEVAQGILFEQIWQEVVEHEVPAESAQVTTLSTGRNLKANDLTCTDLSTPTEPSIRQKSTQ